MKQASGTKQKWILSLALLAVLGSQSYYQVSSNKLNSTELASVSPEELAKIQAEATQKQKDADAKEIASLQAKLKAKTEGRAGSTDCVDGTCSSALIKKVSSPLPVEETEAQIRIRELKERAAERAEERKQRLAEKEEARKEKEELAKEKEEEKKELAKEKKAEEAEKKKEVTAEFNEKMKSIEDDCSGEGIACMGQKLTDTLKEYSGKDVIKPDPAVVTKAFNKYFADSFRLALRDPSAQDEILSTLHELTADLPIEYRQLKEKSLDMVSSATMIEATRINNKFTAAAQLQKAKKYDQALALQIAGAQERDQLTLKSQLMVNEIQSGTTEAKDATTFDYLRSIYLPNINKIIAGLLDTTGNSLNNLNQTTNLNEFTTRSNTRGGVSNFNSNNNTNSSTNLLNTVNFGTPTSTQKIRRVGTGTF